MKNAPKITEKREDAERPSEAEAPNVAPSRRSVAAAVLTLFPPSVVLFLAAFAWYLYAVIDVRLIFQLRDQLFLENVRFFTDFIGVPGGLLEWADRLSVQLCYFGLPGVVFIVVATWVLLISTIGLANAAAGRKIVGAWLVPAALVLYLYDRYFFSTSLLVGLSAAIAAANGFARIPNQKLGVRLAFFAAISIPLYYAVGAAYYIFALCCAIFEIASAKRKASGAFLMIIAVGVKFGIDVALSHLDLATQNFLSAPPNVYQDAFAIRPVLYLFAYFPLCAVFTAIFGVMANRYDKLKATGRLTHREKKKLKTEVKRRQALSPIVKTRLRSTAEAFFVLLATFGLGRLALDDDTKTLLEVEVAAESGQWNDVLDKAAQAPSYLYSPSLNIDVNYALYRTDRLPSKMFRYRQVYLPVTIPQLFQENVRFEVMLRRPCDLLFELGRVNEAEHLALEMFEIFTTSSSMKRLAMMRMVKGQRESAETFLNVLRDDLVWGDWAEERLRRLKTDPNLTDDEEVQKIRRLMVPEDDLNTIGKSLVSGGVVPLVPLMLQKSLERNPQNKMAFEYLMATYLVAGKLQDVVDTLPKLKNFPFSTAPTLYEEAALIYGLRTPGVVTTEGSDIFFRGQKISEQTANRYRRFMAIANSYGGPTEPAKETMANELGGSYFYYFFFQLGRKS